MKAYQLKIMIKNSKPPIWRRVIVPAGLSFSQLELVLNESMGWAGSHLGSFEFKKSLDIWPFFNLKIKIIISPVGPPHLI